MEMLLYEIFQVLNRKYEPNSNIQICDKSCHHLSMHILNMFDKAGEVIQLIKDAYFRLTIDNIFGVVPNSFDLIYAI